MIARYSRPEMAGIWSEAGKLQRWLDVELAALDAWAELGVVPAADVAAIRSTVRVPTPERVAEIEQTTDHDLAAFVDAVAEQLGPEGRWVHYGLTSSDVVDTALALQIQDAGRLVVAGVDRIIDAVVARAEEHRHTVCIGRSHGIHAEPTTFGWKLAGWAFELDRDRARIAAALEANRVGQLSGTVGTYGALDPEVERIACDRLGLEPDPLSTQVIARDRHAELLNALAITATSLERFATEIRHLARTEVREVEEPFAAEMKGSSAMPHKRNPKVAERICGLARVVRSHAIVGLENMPLWHERDISHSSAERVVVPDAFLALDYMLDRFLWIVDGLVVYPERMRRNLDASHGLVF
ncbi:MAG: adenylosuccinate lyase, partial [Actinobacteria bacterium]|nr:adenylosuccinate lyase [Actinomycetota bacterium]